jgi:hypothetical protein
MRRAALPAFAEPALPFLDLFANLREVLAQRIDFALAFLPTLAEQADFFLQLRDPMLLRRHLISNDLVDERWKELSASGPQNGPTQRDAAKQIQWAAGGPRRDGAEWGGAVRKFLTEGLSGHSREKTMSSGNVVFSAAPSSIK